MKKTLLCICMIFSLLLQSVSAVCAIDIGVNASNDFTVVISGEENDVDLSGIDIEVYSSEISYSDASSGYYKYEESYEFTVSTDSSGIVSFERPCDEFSITIKIDTLPQNCGIDAHISFGI